MTKRAYLIIGGLLLTCLPLAAHAQQKPDDVATGRAFAVEFCTACHVVTPDQRRPTIYRGGTPSFAEIANRPSTTAASLWSFVRTTHPTLTRPLDMPAVEVTDYQLDEIIRYILSLRRRH